MKKNFYLLFLLSTLFTAIVVQANVITVKGYVKLTNGNASKNTEVNIAVYLATGTASCSEQLAVTNNEGFYSKEITCTGGDIRKTRISVKNCEGQPLIQEKEVPSSKVVEANFTLCVITPPPCAAKFTAEPAPASSTVPALSEKFNSSISEVGSGDNIVSRTWDFRDGSPLLSNRVDPTHTFPHDGIYEVCLTIKTASGCESKACKAVTVQPARAVACTAKFTFERLGPKKFRFNSTASIIADNDNIIERKWDFRDGSTSNDVSPAHEFAKFGNYEVCLNIKTASGCESRLCVAVKVDEAPVTDNPVSIVSLYPSPAREMLKSVIYSKNNNIAANISIVNLDGVIQPVQLAVVLAQGNNPISLNVFRLPAGSYFYKVKTQYGTLTKIFYKL